jgi:outer membrane cobalamin receptor
MFKLNPNPELRIFYWSLKMKKKSLVPTLVSILCLFSFTQGRADDESIDLSKIVVTPSRIEEAIGDSPAKVDVITSQQIQSSASQDITEVLTRLTGVNISDYGGANGTKSVRMRGSTSAQVLVMVDGRPLNSPRDGEVDLTTVSLDNIDRIEVVHGPGSSLYGSSAMGGTINILTKNPPKQGQKTEVFSTFGTFRTYNEKLSHGARIGDFGYLLNTAYQYSSGHRANSEFDSRDINAKLEYNLNNENLLGFNTGAFKSKSGSPGSISAPDIDDKQKNIKNFQDLNWEFKPDDSVSFSSKIYANHDRLEFMENTPGPWDTANKRDAHTTESRGLDSQVNKRFTDIFQGTYGFNYVANQNNSTTSDAHKYNVRAGYMDNHLDLFDKFKLNLGGRVDDYSNFGTQTNPSFGAVYTFKEDNALRFSIARSFRAPTFNDLYWPDDGMCKGNPSLKPEKGITKEVGIDTRIHKKVRTSLTYFRNDFTNLITWAPDGLLYIPKNVNKARMDGVELGNKVYITDTLDLDLNYSFQKAVDKYTKKDIVYQPRDKVDAALRYHDINGLTCEFTGQFTGRRYKDTENAEPIKKFYVFGLNLSKKVNDNVTGYLWLKNIFNRKYEVIKDYPAAGFSITTGVKVTF